MAAAQNERPVISRKASTYDGPPPPLPPKDIATFESPNLESYFKPLPPSRPASIYSVNRASLSQQLSQLTSINLPDADSLASTVASIPTATAAATALSNAASQIKRWIKKAEEVLGGLDADDDVEWAGSGNRDGLTDVEAAIKRFETLVVTYITSVEEARKRPDIHDVSKADMSLLLDTLDAVVNAWGEVNKSLKRVKRQVELAMEWEELWNTTLGEIGQEIEELSTLVFEMEEKRYKGVFDEGLDSHASALDINELETIVEEAPTDSKTNGLGRFDAPPTIPAHSPLASPTLKNPQDDSSLLTLFARMQPLRASLDFLPMRLSSYETRAKLIFPSACEELTTRRHTLEKKYKALEEDAETLRRELGEDRWVVVFRTAARQAQKMCDSVEKGIVKLLEALESDSITSTPNLVSKRLTDYEAKKNNYGPAVKKVLSMIEKGVKDRLTVNGEVLRINADTRNMWANLEKKLQDTDAALEESQTGRDQALRDSISTIMSSDSAGLASMVDTPGTSPASSVALAPTTEGKGSFPATPDLNHSRSRGSSVRSISSSRPPPGRRVVSQPATTNATKRPPFIPSAMSRLSSASPSPSSRASSSTPTPGSRPRPAPATPSTSEHRPRWTAGGHVDPKILEQRKFKPTAYALALKNARPSAYSFRTPRSVSSTTSSALPSPSPLGAGISSAGGPPGGRFRAASSMGFHRHDAGRRDSSPSPFPTPTELGGSATEGRPRTRLYRPPTQPPTPRLPSYSSSTNKKSSMLPVPSQPSSPLVSAFEADEEEEATPNGNGNGAANGVGNEKANQTHLTPPSVRKSLPQRPASSMAYASSSSTVPGGRRNSLLPLPRMKEEKQKWKL
ncbi:hypothetical protein MMC10_003295 [Thelotrema lepadinum]|nr:hypothetical protein [Thelotrema lepadinum]